MKPTGFAADLNAYLQKVLADNGKTDRSGRWLEEITEKARRYDYWAKIVKDTRAMTTNDIDVLAKAFGVTAFDWVDYTEKYARGADVPTLIFNVSDSMEDGDTLTPEQERAIRKSDVDLAALHGRNEADTQQAD